MIEDNIVFRESWVLMNIQDTKTKLTGLSRGVTLRLLLLLDFHFNGNRELKTKQNIVGPLKLYKNTNFILKPAEWAVLKIHILSLHRLHLFHPWLQYFYLDNLENHRSLA